MRVIRCLHVHGGSRRQRRSDASGCCHHGCESVRVGCQSRDCGDASGRGGNRRANGARLPGSNRPLRHALVAIVCVLGLHRPCLPGFRRGARSRRHGAHRCARKPRGSRRSGGATSDTAVRQVVLGIISFTCWPTTPVRLHSGVTGRPDHARGLTDTLQAGSTLLDVQRALRRSRARHRLRHRLSRQPSAEERARAWGSGGRPSGADNFGKRSILHRGRHVLSQRRRRARVVRHQSRRGRTQWRARASERAQSRATAGAP